MTRGPHRDEMVGFGLLFMGESKSANLDFCLT